jgi:hypothetical protein
VAFLGVVWIKFHPYSNGHFIYLKLFNIIDYNGECRRIGAYLHVWNIEEIGDLGSRPAVGSSAMNNLGLSIKVVQCVVVSFHPEYSDLNFLRAIVRLVISLPLPLIFASQFLRSAP